VTDVSEFGCRGPHLNAARAEGSAQMMLTKEGPWTHGFGHLQHMPSHTFVRLGQVTISHALHWLCPKSACECLYSRHVVWRLLFMANPTRCIAAELVSNHQIKGAVSVQQRIAVVVWLAHISLQKVKHFEFGSPSVTQSLRCC